MTSRPFIELAVCLLLTAATARADDAFKQHYENGLNLYSSEDYQSAVKEFQAAYGIKPKPRLLFNIGQSYRSLGNAREALRFYLMYQTMESNPKPGLKAELEGYITQMKSIVEQAERARQVEEQAPPAVSPAPEAVVTPALLSTPPPPSHKKNRAWIWGVAGGVAVSVVVIGLAAGLTRTDSYHGEILHPTF